MKIAVFLTCYHRLEELGRYAAFLDKNSTHLREFEIVLYCNNPEVSEEEFDARASKFKNNKVHRIRSAQNAGWQFGSFEGLVRNYDFLRQFDVVIHTHQNVYPVHGECLLLLLRHFIKSEAVFLCSELDQNPSMEPVAVASEQRLLYCTDFFAFKPGPVPVDFFDAYRSVDFKNEIAESFLKIMIHRNAMPVSLIQRFPQNAFHRELDFIGLWHEHNLERVTAYLADPQATSLYEFDPRDFLK